MLNIYILLDLSSLLFFEIDSALKENILQKPIRAEEWRYTGWCKITKKCFSMIPTLSTPLLKVLTSKATSSGIIAPQKAVTVYETLCQW